MDHLSVGGHAPARRLPSFHELVRLLFLHGSETAVSGFGRWLA